MGAERIIDAEFVDDPAAGRGAAGPADGPEGRAPSGDPGTPAVGDAAASPAQQLGGGLAQTFGLHPLVGFGLFAIDWMLFGGEAFSGGVALPLTVLFGLALAIPSTLLQRYAYRDGWGTALGKGIMMGVLTAVPTALPSVVPAGLGAVGAARLLGAARRKASLPANEK